MSRSDFVLAVVLAVLALTQESRAQWSVAILHPAGASNSWAIGCGGTQQVGFSDWTGGERRASLWTGSAASWTNLNPAGVVPSDLSATNGTQQVGSALFAVGAIHRAGLWSGSAGSWIDLHPPGATQSAALALSETQQGGHAIIGTAVHASLWTGTPHSWIDLNPSGSTQSQVLAMAGNQQAGWAYIGSATRAGMWTGTATSWVDLHPSDAVESLVYSTDGIQQAGYTYGPARDHASVWYGTASSRIDLHPPVATESRAYGVVAGYQVGYVRLAGQYRASVWNGTPESWGDLHAVLPEAFISSEARGISTDGVNLYVCGFGGNSQTGRTEALLWTRPLPCTNPVVQVPPMSLTVCRGDSASITITATGTSPQFQWRRNEVDIPGATDATLTFPSVTLADSGSYDCIITNACGTITTNTATLTVRTPQILTQPASQTVNVDQPVFFALEADPQHPCFSALAYRWQRRNPLVEDDTAPNAWLDLSDGGGFAGTHSASLAIFRPTPGLANGYRCKITNACGCEADANGVVYTDIVNFTAACPSDFNNDGSVDGDDVIEFFERWDSGC